MPSDPPNLLPEDRVRAFRRGYLFRLGTVAELLLTAGIVVSGTLLIPTHVFLQNQISLHQQKLVQLSLTNASADEKDFESRLATLSTNAARIQELNQTRSESSVLASVLALAHPGVQLRGFTFTPLTTKAPATVVVSGTADTRDDLRQYQLILQEAPFVTAANLPVSAYAKDKDIDFSITLSLASP